MGCVKPSSDAAVARSETVISVATLRKIGVALKADAPAVAEALNRKVNAGSGVSAETAKYARAGFIGSGTSAVAGSAVDVPAWRRAGLNARKEARAHGNSRDTGSSSALPNCCRDDVAK
jgi:hypothetical protein